MDQLPAWTVVGFLVLHVGAIACACGTRVAMGSRLEPLVQCLFFLALLAVGMATWVCHTAHLGLGLPSGLTLLAMVLTAVVDFRRSHEATARASVAMHR